MTNSSIKILLAAAVAFAVYSCDDDSTSTIGSSLTGSDVSINIDSAFTVTGKTVRIENIRPQANSFLLGKMAIHNYGDISCDIVAQFLPSIQLDTANYSYENVDSLFLTMRYAIGNYMGDSIAPMGLTVYQLNKLLPSGISSDFNPEGYYDTKPLATTTYNTLPESNPLNSSGNYREINVTLPTSLGQRIFRDFQNNPANFADGRVFASNVFPGVYIKSSFGSGRMTMISSTSLTFHLQKVEKVTVSEDSVRMDTTTALHQYMLVTPEVISNNDLKYNMSESIRKLYDEGKDLLVAPAGYEMELTLPGKELAEAFRKAGENTSVLNNLTLTIPCDSIENNAEVTPPPYVLLVLKKDREQFFANNKLPDNITSFYAGHSDNAYTFSNMRAYLQQLLEKDEISAEDCTFCLVPVTVNFEAQSSGSYYYSQTSYVETDMQPYFMAPVMGTVDLTNAKIKLTYTTQKVH